MPSDRQVCCPADRRTALVSVMLFALVVMARSAVACELAPGGDHAVARVVDGETIQLDDGREVRLVNALAPRPEDADADAAFWQPTADARAALEQLVAGRTVSLGYVGRRRDRHGRWLAQVFTRADPPVWVQGYMVENGHARAHALPGAGDCLAALLPLEARARDARLGLWSNAAYRVRPADPAWHAGAGRDRFHLVEGEVRNVRTVRGRHDLDFGSDRQRDFTVTIPRPVLREAIAHGIDPATLAGARIRVRGWVIWRDGPSIEVTDAAEIEVLGR